MVGSVIFKASDGCGIWAIDYTYSLRWKDLTSSQLSLDSVSLVVAAAMAEDFSDKELPFERSKNMVSVLRFSKSVNLATKQAKQVTSIFILRNTYPRTEHTLIGTAAFLSLLLAAILGLLSPLHGKHRPLLLPRHATLRQYSSRKTCTRGDLPDTCAYQK
jgi:hypothetical protein